MPSPNNITELIIFAGGAIGFVVLLFVASRFTNVGRRLTGDWKPGPIDLPPIEDKSVPRREYIDPLARLKPQYVLIPVVITLALLFVYYFLTKQTFQSGN